MIILGIICFYVIGMILGFSMGKQYGFEKGYRLAEINSKEEWKKWKKQA